MADQAEVVHLAYRRASNFGAPWNRIPEPGSAVCSGDAAGWLTFDWEEVDCLGCIQIAYVRWMMPWRDAEPGPSDSPRPF